MLQVMDTDVIMRAYLLPIYGQSKVLRRFTTLDSYKSFTS